MLYDNHNTPQKTLQDLKPNGKERPWRPHKINSLKIGESLVRIGEERGERYTKRGRHMLECSPVLIFGKNPGKERRLIYASFCRGRLCPMCEWRRSLKMAYHLSNVINRITEDFPEKVPCFLTLTAKAVKGEGLKDLVAQLIHGWHQLANQKKFSRISVGWFRALEVKYNRKKDTYQPHIHVILLVDKSYFTGKDYMHTTEWVKKWRQACRFDYDPVCYIRKLGGNKRKAAQETAKYITKPDELIHQNPKKQDEIVHRISDALAHRRVYAFGGWMKAMSAELSVEVASEKDLVNVDDIRPDVYAYFEKYVWSDTVKHYLFRWGTRPTTPNAPHQDLTPLRPAPRP